MKQIERFNQFMSLDLQAICCHLIQCSYNIFYYTKTIPTNRSGRPPITFFITPHTVNNSALAVGYIIGLGKTYL